MTGGPVGSISVDVDPLIDALQGLSDDVARRALESAAMAGGLVIEAAGKEGVIRYDFIDTGATLNSVAPSVARSSAHEVEIEVGPSTDYAIYGELGLGGQSPKPFMREAIDNSRNAVTAVVADALRDAIRRSLS